MGTIRTSMFNYKVLKQAGFDVEIVKENEKMKHEQLLKDIEEQLTKNRCAMRWGCTGDDLRENNNLLGRIKTVLKTAGNEYERGCEDAWEFCRKLELNIEDGGLPCSTQKNIFGSNWSIGNILTEHKTYKEALAKVEAYNQKKKEEAEKPVVGDVVLHEITGDEFVVTNIEKGFITGIDRCFIKHTYCYPNEYIKKTGKHVELTKMIE